MNPQKDPTTTDTPRTQVAVLPERMVVRLLVVLAAATGSLDVVCVTRLGGPFASVVTGNLVQLGRGVAAPDGPLVVGVAAAVAGYALGVAAGTAGLGRSATKWRRRTTLIALTEVTLLAGFAAVWLATEGRPDANATIALLAVAGAAMGVQSAITISSGVHDASTTYMTGTLTSVVRTLVAGPHRFVTTGGGAARLAALLCAATVGALLLRVTPLWASTLPVALVATVVGIAVQRTRRAAARSRVEAGTRARR